MNVPFNFICTHWLEEGLLAETATVPSIVCCIYSTHYIEFEYQKIVLDNIVWVRKRSGHYLLILLHLCNRS